MSEQPGLEAVEAGLQEKFAVSGDSMMDDLRAEYATLRDRKTTDIELPGYSGKMVARYRLLDLTNDLNRIGKRIRREFKGDESIMLYWAVVDTLAEACEGLFYHNGTELVSLAKSIGPDEPPIVYDDRLAEFLDFEATDARACVIGAFGGNQAAIMSHGRKLNDWMTDTTQSIDEVFLGESSGS